MTLPTLLNSLGELTHFETGVMESTVWIIDFKRM